MQKFPSINYWYALQVPAILKKEEGMQITVRVPTGNKSQYMALQTFWSENVRNTLSSTCAPDEGYKGLKIYKPV